MAERKLTVVSGELRLGRRLVDIWNHRELLVLLTRSELKIKYKSSVLGYLWSMLNPALVLAIYDVAFTIINKAGLPDYAIWLFAGLLAWNLFNNAVMGSTTVVVGKAGIVKKVAFPRELLALSTVGVAFVLFVIQVVVLIMVMGIFHFYGVVGPDWTFVALLPLALLALLIFTSAISILLSAVNVYMRDTQHLTEVALMAWFWLSPIVYTWKMIAEKLDGKGLGVLKWVYTANPITPILLTFQRAIYGVDQYSTSVKTGNTTVVTTYYLLPQRGLGFYAAMLGAVLIVSIVLFLISVVVFGRLEGNFAEEL